MEEISQDFWQLHINLQEVPGNFTQLNKVHKKYSNFTLNIHRAVYVFVVEQRSPFVIHFDSGLSYPLRTEGELCMRRAGHLFQFFPRVFQPQSHPMAVSGLQHPVAVGGGRTPLHCAYPVAGTQLSHPTRATNNG